MEKKRNEVVKENKKEENGFVVWMKENNKALLCGLAGLIIGVLVMGILWPERIAKLEDGREVVVELSNTSITADDLYSKLKSSGGINALISLIDTSILKDKYEIDEEAEEYAKTQSEQYYSMYESYYGMSKDEFLSANGFADEEAFFNYLREEFLYQKYYQDYLASLVTEEEIDDFYKDDVFADRTVHVFSSTSEDNNLEKVRKELKKGTKVSKLEDKYDGVSYTKLDNVSFDSEEYSETFLDEVAKLEKGKYSAVFKDDGYGYTVVYVSDVKEMPELADVEDRIIEVIGAKKDQADQTLYYKAFVELREAYKMKFYDKELQELYDDTIASYIGTDDTEEETEKE